jgi:Asp-tRNA(Asn)/Glu-tRNA(Gln) amidotransferase A subunit family amidase
LEKRIYEGSDPAYDPKKMADLPVGVQIVGRAWEEEKVLAMMSVVEEAVGYGSA